MLTVGQAPALATLWKETCKQVLSPASHDVVRHKGMFSCMYDLAV